jgi:hypothetical protein
LEYLACTGGEQLDGEQRCCKFTVKNSGDSTDDQKQQLIGCGWLLSDLFGFGPSD